MPHRILELRRALLRHLWHEPTPSYTGEWNEVKVENRVLMTSLIDVVNIAAFATAFKSAVTSVWSCGNTASRANRQNHMNEVVGYRWDIWAVRICSWTTSILRSSLIVLAQNAKRLSTISDSRSRSKVSAKMFLSFAGASVGTTLPLLQKATWSRKCERDWIKYSVAGLDSSYSTDLSTLGGRLKAFDLRWIDAWVCTWTKVVFLCRFSTTSSSLTTIDLSGGSTWLGN